jgi:hypothetical protein
MNLLSLGSKARLLSIARFREGRDDAEEATKRVPEVPEKLQNDVAAEIKAIWEGFSRFSQRELRLEPETVVSVWFARPGSSA